MVLVQRKMSSSSNDDSSSVRDSIDRVHHDDHDDRTNLLDSKRRQPKRSRTLTWSEIPEWMQDNVFITAGYRAPTNSYVRCAQSLFYLHNESGSFISLQSFLSINLLTRTFYSQYMEPLTGIHCILWARYPFSLVSAICR